MTSDLNRQQVAGAENQVPIPNPEPVKANAIVGRRLQEGQFTAIGEHVRYRFEAFFDTRVNENLSVDLIGEDGNERSSRIMQATAGPIARKDFELTKVKSPFVGWAGIRRKTLPARHVVLRTPVTEGENPNPLHCDIVRDKFREKDLARALAYELCRHAEDDNMLVHAPPMPSTT